MQGGDGIRVRSGHGYLREFTRDLRIVSGKAKVSSGAAQGLVGLVGLLGRRHSELIGTKSEPGWHYCVRGSSVGSRIRSLDEPGDTKKCRKGIFPV